MSHLQIFGLWPTRQFLTAAFMFDETRNKAGGGGSRPGEFGPAKSGSSLGRPWRSAAHNAAGNDLSFPVEHCQAMVEASRARC